MVKTSNPTFIQMSSFSTVGDEMDFFVGPTARSIYHVGPKPVTWNGTGWKYAERDRHRCSEDDEYSIKYRIETRCGDDVKTDNLIRTIVRFKFPNIDVLPTPAPAPVTISYDAGTESLYWYRATAADTAYVTGQLVIGTLASLEEAFPGRSFTELISYQPRHQVMWTPYVGVAALRRAKLSFSDGCNTHEEVIDRNVQMFEFSRLKSGHRRAIMDEACQLNLGRVRASTNGITMLGSYNDDELVTFVPLMFSFSDSVHEDLGGKTNRKSALSVSGSCADIKISYMRDVRELLILEEEQMQSVADESVIILSPSADPITATINVGTTSSGSFTFESAAITSTMSELGITYIEPTDEFFAVQKGDGFDYSTWIAQGETQPEVDLKYEFGTVTQIEAIRYKSDCLSKSVYYRDIYRRSKDVRPASDYILDFEDVYGLLQYGWVAARNETSRRQGFFFNFTNDTSYIYRRVNGIDHIDFTGEPSISRLRIELNDTRVDSDYGKFFRLISPMVARNSPVVKGVLMAPVYTLHQGTNLDMTSTLPMPGMKISIKAEMLGSGPDEYAGGESTDRYRLFAYLLTVRKYIK